MAKKHSPLKELVKQTVQEMHGQEFPKDPHFDPSEEITGPERFIESQKRKDEVVIDELLTDISGKEGYFLKLKKEMRPNEWMLMQVIENDWRNWADIEVEISKIIREYTKKAPQKWGSGVYRIEITCKGGMRGKKYPPIDYPINAEEEYVGGVSGNGNGNGVLPVDPTIQVTSQLDMLEKLLGAVKGVIPPASDPAQMQNLLANSFAQGMNMKIGEGTSNNQMMIALITGMMGMMKEFATAMRPNNDNMTKVINQEDQFSKMLGVMKEFGVLQTNGGEKVNSLSMLKELKELGVDLFKKDDPIDQINKFKQIASIAVDLAGLGGTGERPSVVEKLIDALAPHIPTVLSDVKTVAENAVKVQQLAGENIDKAKRMNNHRNFPVSDQTQTPPYNVEPTPSSQNTTYEQMKSKEKQEVVVNEQVVVFFNQLFDAMKSNNRLFYPIVYTSLLQDGEGHRIIQNIIAGKSGSGELIHLIQQYGGERFKDGIFVQQFVVPYVNGFVMWIKRLMNNAPEQYPMVGEGFDVKCNLCNEVFVYPTEAEFTNDEDKVCGKEKVDGGKCSGILELMKVGTA